MSEAVGETLDRWYAAIKSGDGDSLRAVMTDDIAVDYASPAGLLPWGGIWNGPDAATSFFATVAEHLEVDAVQPLETHMTGSTAIVMIKGRWTVKSTGAKVTARAVNVFSMRDGKVARYQVFNDTAAFAVGLGRLAAA